jgi:hypothetical protein
MTKEEMREFQRVKKKNDKIRKEIDELIGINHPLYSPIWEKINELIENEIEQEGYCNQ